MTEGVTLHVGDVRDVLPTLPDESVDCVATSPPFYGLRDYGTGEWEGGDPGCDHVRGSDHRDLGFNDRWGRPTGERKQEEARKLKFTDVCGKCGARRVDRQIGLEATPSCQRQGLMRLRADLTPDQREYVARRLLELGPLDV